MDDLVAAFLDIGRQLPPDAKDVVSRHDLRGDAHLPGLLGEGAVPEAYQLGGDGLIQVLQQAQNMGLGPAGVAAADEMNDFHNKPRFTGTRGVPKCSKRFPCVLPQSII